MICGRYVSQRCKCERTVYLNFANRFTPDSDNIVHTNSLFDHFTKSSLSIFLYLSKSERISRQILCLLSPPNRRRIKTDRTPQIIYVIQTMIYAMMNQRPNYGTVADDADPNTAGRHRSGSFKSSFSKSLTSLNGVTGRVAFSASTKSQTITDADGDEKDLYSALKLKKSSCDYHHTTAATASPLQLRQISSDTEACTDDDDDDQENDKKGFFSHSNLRKFAIDVSLWINIAITVVKAIAYLETSSLSILAALVDSVLDVVSQFILAYTEHRSSKSRSSARYPAGAARLEPVGVLSCAALMGFASLGVLKESLEKLYIGVIKDESILGDEDWSSFWSMFSIVVVKLGLYWLCQKVGTVKSAEAAATNNNGDTMTEGAVTTSYYVDSTMDALAQDHWNDCLSNVVAAVALFFTLSNEHLWVLDPIGAIFISCYIIFSWYATGKEQIEQLTGKAAPREFIDELYETADNFDPKMVVSVSLFR